MVDNLRSTEVNISSPELKTLLSGLKDLTKTRFHINARDHFILEDIKELDEERLLELIQEHEQTQVPRLKELLDYFENVNHGILKRKDRDSNLSDVRACHPYASYITGFTVAYISGEGIKVTAKDKTMQERIQNLNFDKLNLQTLLNTSIYGRAYELVYRNEDGIDKAASLDPKQCFIIYDDTVETKPIAGVRYRLNKENQYIVDLYTDTHIIRYLQNDTSKLDEVERVEHFYKECPMIECSNNEFRQGDFEKVIDLIDLYDYAQSDMANYSVDLNNAMLVILGDMKLELKDAIAMKNKNVLLLEPAIDEYGHYSNCDAKYIYKQYDVQGTEAYKKRIQRDIHKFTNTPDMNDEDFAGNQSGESMRYKLFGLEQLRVIKQTLFTECARKRYSLILGLRSITQSNSFNIEDLEFTFTPNIPKSFYEEVKAFIELGGQLSQETILTLFSLVKDPIAELKLIKKENEDSITQAQKMLNQGRQYQDNQLVGNEAKVNE